MRERMLSGELYLARDPELVAMLSRAQRLLHAFNTSHPDEIPQQQALMKDLFGALGKEFEIKPPFRCDYGVHIFAGERLFINYDCVILDCNTVRLGDRVLLGPKVQIYTATHPLDPAERIGGWEAALPIEIGNDVWIGGGAIICPGVTVGDGSTIGAGSVVTRDVPPGVFAAGNPCRVIRELRSEGT
ncbi:MAG: sugar O-acetyltransferase [Leptolyngbya sp. SIO1E4]|nr:sugar O-acetyltransferase [Leptolyngbya sp. SIO1E4]